jgi:hypothetical protein
MQYGHVRRRCPHAGTTNSTDTYQANGAGTGVKEYKVFSTMQVGRNRTPCLIDTGCEQSMVPLSMVRHIKFPPCADYVKAANGSQIRINGKKVNSF